MKTVKSLEYSATVLLPFHAALGAKFDDAVHRLSSALGQATWDETLGKARCALNGKVTVGTKSVCNLADGAPHTLLYNVATQLANVTGGVMLTSSIPKACQAWVDASLKDSKDGLSGWIRGKEGQFVTMEAFEAAKAAEKAIA